MSPFRRMWKRFTGLFRVRVSNRCPICKRKFADVAKHQARRHTVAPP